MLQLSRFLQYLYFGFTRVHNVLRETCNETNTLAEWRTREFVFTIANF